MARIKISELPELDIATLNTTYVAGVYDNTTFKIPINRLTSSLDTTFATDLVVNAVSGTINTLATTASFNSLSSSLDSRLDRVEIFSSSADSRYILSGSIRETTWDNIANKPVGIVSQSTDLSSLNSKTGSYATTGSNTFTDNQTILGFITASSYLGNGRYLKNLSPSTNWNYNQEFTIEKTEQLTFSGDYILEDSYLYIEGGVNNSIGNWIPVNFNGDGSITRTSDNTYRIDGPNDNNADGWLFIKKYFDTETTMSIDYSWSSQDDAGLDRPIYDVSEQEPEEVDIVNRLDDTNAQTETGTWTINVPANRWVAIGVYSVDSAAGSGSLSVTLPYLPNEDSVQYSANKYFKKEGSIFIGGNLLVKDSYIENDGLISVGGEVILIGNSQIEGTGKII